MNTILPQADTNTYNKHYLLLNFSIYKDSLITAMCFLFFK